MELQWEHIYDLFSHCRQKEKLEQKKCLIRARGPRHGLRDSLRGCQHAPLFDPEMHVPQRFLSIFMISVPPGIGDEVLIAAPATFLNIRPLTLSSFAFAALSSPSSEESCIFLFIASVIRRCAWTRKSFNSNPACASLAVATTEAACKSTTIGVANPFALPSPAGAFRSMVISLSILAVNCTFLSSPKASLNATSVAAANSVPV